MLPILAARYSMRKLAAPLRAARRSRRNDATKMHHGVARAHTKKRQPRGLAFCY